MYYFQKLPVVNLAFFPYFRTISLISSLDIHRTFWIITYNYDTWKNNVLTLNGRLVNYIGATRAFACHANQ